MHSNKNRVLKVLVAPLDWGLGHATRCIPIIKGLLGLGCTVHLAGNGRSLTLLRSEFPALAWHSLPDYAVRYENKSMEWAMIKQAPRILKAIKMEQIETRALQNNEHFDLIVSDNRYGVYVPSAHNVFVCHQLNIKVNGLWSIAKPLLDGQNKSRIEVFDELWIPDDEGPNNLSGSLSDVSSLLDIDKKFLGVLSRFVAKSEASPKYKTVSVLSGPEPQRSRFEESLLQQLAIVAGKHLLVRGVSETDGSIVSGDVTIVDHLKSHELQAAFENSEVAISRSGYSSIMDYVCLGQKAILVPTPGQTEQLFLAERLASRDAFVCQTQNDIDVLAGLKKLMDSPAPEAQEENVKLSTVLQETFASLAGTIRA